MKVIRDFLVVLGAVLGGHLGAQDSPVEFIRGDIDANHEYTFNDVKLAVELLLTGAPPPECSDALDSNDDGFWSWADPILLHRFLFTGGFPPPPPFPHVGIDVTPGFVCEHGPAMDDPAAQVEVLDADAPGGESCQVGITLVLSNSIRLAGYGLTLRDEAGVIDRVSGPGSQAVDLTGTFGQGGPPSILTVTLGEDHRIRAGGLVSPMPEGGIPPGASRPFLRLDACLRQGVEAGEYPITLEGAELVDYASGSTILPARVSGTLRVLETVSDGAGGPPVGQTFVRGDNNGDGRLSVADLHWSSMLLFFLKTRRQCDDALDANDDGQIDLADPVFLARYLIAGDLPPPHPFTSRGDDPTPDGLDCGLYGGGVPLADPAAKLQVLDTEVRGGADRHAFITLALSHSTRGERTNAGIGGYSMTIRDEAGVIENIGEPGGPGSGDLTGEISRVRNPWGVPAQFLVRLDPSDGIHVVVVAALLETIPPVEDRPVLLLSACVKDGTPAGDYPLTVEAAEFADFETGRAILPERVSGTLRVIESVDDPVCQPGEVEPPPAPEVNVLFRILEGSGAPGGEVKVPFIIKADRPSQGFSFSLDHDETMLEATGITKLFTRPQGIPYEFERFEVQNDDSTPGSSGIAEGFVAGAAILSFTDTASVLPVHRDVPVLEITYRIQPSVPMGKTALRFEDGAPGELGAVNNKLIAGGEEVFPSTAGSFVFVHGLIQIVPEISIFIRGDSNRDWTVNISDPINTLGYLFTGQNQVPCPDAADTDDNGALQLTDAIRTLNGLFQEGPPPLPPYPRPGLDVTEDPLDCVSE